MVIFSAITYKHLCAVNYVPYFMKVLIVEDDRIALQLLSRLLREEFDLLICKSYDQAQEELTRRNDVKLIVSGLLVQGVHGVEFANNVRSHLNLGIPLIMVANTENEDELDSLFDSGVNECIPKPLKKSDFLFKAKRLIEKFVQD